MRNRFMKCIWVVGLLALFLSGYSQKGGMPSPEEAKEKLNQLKASKRIDEVSETNFIYCAQMGDMEAVQAYLASGMGPNVKNKLGRSPLMAAAATDDSSPWYSKNVDVVKLLLKNGADVNAKDNDGITALKMMANDMNRTAVVQLLKEAGAQE